MSNSNALMDDELLFADEDDTVEEQNQAWKILLVDDEPSVHEVTRMTLNGFTYEGRGIEFLHAYSGKEAKQVIEEQPDIALVLLDVVMEEEHAGLQVVRHVRDVLENHFVRIVLRTGQPGQSPETEVIIDYDINDYKEKTELTAQKLKTVVITTLRAYQTIMQLEKSRKGLQYILNASASVFKIKSMEAFVHGILTQISALAGLNDDAFCAVGSTLVSCYERAGGEINDVSHILAGTGRYESKLNQPLSTVLDQATLEKVNQARSEKRSLFFDHECVIYFEGSRDTSGILYLTGKDYFDDTERSLIELFGHNLAIAYDNIDLNTDLQHTQEDVIHMLGTVSEFHSEETSLHVQRVGRYVARLAELSGMAEHDVELLEQAAPLHDMGKIGISDAILNKPGRLTDEEMVAMKRHSEIGYDILRKNPNRPVLMAASIIAHEHHEKWDGSGYPRGLKGEDIHVYGRMSAIADVFDALGCRRCYKDAWGLDEIRQYFEQQRGKHFDPQLTDLFLHHYDDFSEILDELSDEQSCSQTKKGER